MRTNLPHAQVMHAATVSPAVGTNGGVCGVTHRVATELARAASFKLLRPLTVPPLRDGPHFLEYIVPLASRCSSMSLKKGSSSSCRFPGIVDWSFTTLFFLTALPSKLFELVPSSISLKIRRFPTLRLIIVTILPDFRVGR